MNRNGKVVGDTNYLEKVQGFISANLVEEPIYENLKKEAPIYQNLQDVHVSSSEKELAPTLPPKKSKSSDGMGVDGENQKQDIKSSEAQAELTSSKRHAMMLDPQQVAAILQDTEEISQGKKYAYTQTFPLSKGFKAIKILFKEYGQKIVDAICNLFKKEVITKIEGEGYNVNSNENEGIVVRGSKPIDAQKINKYIASFLTETMVKNKENIESLGNNYKGKQLEQKALESLVDNFQKKDMNYIEKDYNDGEPIFQSLEELGYHSQQRKDIDSNSMRGTYNGEPTHQTAQEARNYYQQKRGINQIL